MISWTFNNLSGFLPRPSSTPAAPVTPKTAVASAAPEQASMLAPNPHLAARRALALRSMFPKLSSWFASRRDSLYMGEINEYLAQAANVTDLEQRIHLIERQRHFS